jgi:hypothetical protein
MSLENQLRQAFSPAINLIWQRAFGNCPACLARLGMKCQGYQTAPGEPGSARLIGRCSVARRLHRRAGIGGRV